MKKCIKENETNKKCNPIYLIGPRGPRGKEGKVPEFEIENVASGLYPKVTIRKENNKELFSFILPKGDKGDPGTNKIRNAYLVTFNGGTGISVNENSAIPISRKEIDITNLITLDSTENTIKFNTIGYYKITIIASAYVKKTGAVFDEKTDFSAIALRQKETDNIYIGSSVWTPDEIPKQILAEGILSVDSTDNTYEIVNIGKQTLYLNTPDLRYINSNSYFVNSPLTINIEFLGKATD